MKKWFIGLVVILISSVVYAKPHQLTWDWPTLDCESLSLAQSDLIESELIFDVVSMPMPSDTEGECAATLDPDAPLGATVVSIPVTDSVVTLNLKPGRTYYARIRVSAYVSGNWSSWSTQLQFTVPYGRPRKVILSYGVVRYESEMISVTKIRFGKT